MAQAAACAQAVGTDDELWYIRPVFVTRDNDVVEVCLRDVLHLDDYTHDKFILHHGIPPDEQARIIHLRQDHPRVGLPLDEPCHGREQTQQVRCRLRQYLQEHFLSSHMIDFLFGVYFRRKEMLRKRRDRARVRV